MRFERTYQMGIKAIAVDIDRTLVNDDREITSRTREALIDAQRAGVRLVIASGRPTQGVQRYARQLELAKYGGLILSYNGGRAVDARTGETLFERILPNDIVEQLLNHVRKYDVVPWFVDGEELIVENAFPDDIFIDGESVNIIKTECFLCDLRVHEVKSLTEWADRRPQPKLLIAASDTYLAERWREIAAPFEGKLESLFSCSYYYEFMPMGVDKGTGLASALSELGIDASEVVAFGDEQNDVGMIRWAGTGVAMGNATDEVKAVADRVTLTNNEDGIAAALEDLLA